MTDVLCPVVLGRDAELAALDRALAGARAGEGHAVFVTGEPGIGKSRLARELATRAQGVGATVVVGRAVPTGTGTPYRPLTEALLQALRNRPLPEDGELAPWLPALHALLPTIVAPTDAPGDVSSAVRGEALLQLLRRIAGADGLVVVLEDLHWADPDTLAVVEYLSDNAGSGPVLLVATIRDESSPALDLARRLRARAAAMTLTLARLDDDQVADMVRACVPGADAARITSVRASADGVPFLVEELLASPGVPRSFQATVSARLAELDEGQRLVLDTAAVLGRHFDWRLLAAATGRPPDVVTGALQGGVTRLLLSVEGDAFRFRHALTREAIVGQLLPPRRTAIAAAALGALDAVHPDLGGAWIDIAADLAAQSGDTDRAAMLLTQSGRASLERGALATAVDTLRRAGDVAGGSDERNAVDSLLVEALSLAGRVDEALAVGDRLITRLADDGADGARAEVHVRLAHAAVSATRWPTASAHLAAAADLLIAEPSPELRARATVLEAEVAYGGDDADRARALADEVLASGQATPETRCHALEIVGRSERNRDLAAAREVFERALATADAAHLPIWRLRALHELGTIEMLDRADTTRLLEARRMADDVGALSTGAVLDIQLAAAFQGQFDLDRAAAHAHAAADVGERLGLGRITAMGRWFVAADHALRLQGEDMERYLALATAAAPDDRDIEGFNWAGCRAMLAMLVDDREAAFSDLERGMDILRTLKQPALGPYQAMWPLLLAHVGDGRAAEEVEDVRRRGATLHRINAGLLGYAEAILAGRSGDHERADELARTADVDLVRYPVWGDLGRMLAAESALSDGRWGRPDAWLERCRSCFVDHGYEVLAERCRSLLGGPAPSRWAGLGITRREAEVLVLVGEGLANKEIAIRLGVSPRTVEKHVESLLRKTDARSRTHLVAIAGPPG